MRVCVCLGIFPYLVCWDVRLLCVCVHACVCVCDLLRLFPATCVCVCVLVGARFPTRCGLVCYVSVVSTRWSDQTVLTLA